MSLFLNSGFGVAVGYDGIIVVTENSGKTWKRISNPHTTERLNGVTETKLSHFLIVGDEGIMLDLYVNE